MSFPLVLVWMFALRAMKLNWFQYQITQDIHIQIEPEFCYFDIQAIDTWNSEERQLWMLDWMVIGWSCTFV